MLHKNTKSKTDQAQLDKQIAQEREENGKKPLKEKEDKETIERQSESAKEDHNFRYTNMKGKAKMDMKAAFTFACLNMKKLALMMYRMDPNKDVSTRLFAKTHKKLEVILNLIKLSKPREKFLGLSSL